MQTLTCQRAKFHLQRKTSYLNCAYMSPLPKKVANAGVKGLLKKRHPYQIQPEDFFHDAETIRLLFGQLINIPEPKRVVLIPSVSYGMANVVNNLHVPGDILIPADQFPSNVYPWLKLQEKGFRVCFIPKPEETNWSQAILEAINKQTRVLAISHVHWADGTLFELENMRRRLRDVGALLIVDGTQSVGALPFDCKKIQPDALICAGYKWLMGPYNVGMAYYGPYFDKGNPIEENWINRKNSADFSRLNEHCEDYHPGALRYEVGEHSNFIALPMLIESLKLIQKWSPERIQTYTQQLFEEPLHHLKEHGYSVNPPMQHAHHLFGLYPPKTVSIKALMDRFRERRIYVSNRGQCIRVSPHVYNDVRDVNRFTEILTASFP